MNLNDLQTQHTAYIHRFGTQVTNEVIKLLDASDKRLLGQIRDILDDLRPQEVQSFLRGKYNTRRLETLRDALNEMASSVRPNFYEVVEVQGKSFAGYEVERSNQILHAIGLAAVANTKVSPGKAYREAISRPAAGSKILDWVNGIDATYKRRIFAEIRDGYNRQESNSQIIARIRGTAPARYRDGVLFSRKRALETVVRTTLAHLSSVARELSFIESEIDEYFLLVVYDGRTSDICASWNPGGVIKYYKVGQGPVPPFHPNCRTDMMARGENDDSFLKPFVADNRPVSRIPKNQRDGKIGRTRKPTFGAWFDTQDAAFQREWLGPKRYTLYKQGNYSLDRFTDPRGKRITLDQLRQTDQDLFDRLEI